MEILCKEVVNTTTAEHDLSRIAARVSREEEKWENDKGAQQLCKGGASLMDGMPKAQTGHQYHRLLATSIHTFTTQPLKKKKEKKKKNKKHS